MVLCIPLESAEAPMNLTEGRGIGETWGRGPTERKLGLTESCWRQHFLAGNSVDCEISIFMEHFAKRFQAVLSFSQEDTLLLPELFPPVGSQISRTLRLNSILFRTNLPATVTSHLGFFGSDQGFR